MASDVPPPPPPASEPVSEAPAPPTPDDRNMAILCHIGGILTGFIIPLIIWLIKKDQSKFVDDQGKEALNFQITMLLGHIVGGLTFCIHMGILNLAIWVLTIVFGILATVAVSKGQRYRYPLTIRMIK
jgi:uncharacterized Tic20 family protein